MISSSFLALPDDVVVDQVHVLYECATVVLRSITLSAACPLCSHLATHVHSRYQRMIADVPSGGRQVVLSLLVRKFFCQNSQCPRRIFAERLPEVVRPRARMTLRFCAALEAIGFATSGEAGARLATLLGMPTSASTMLRRIKTAAPPASRKVTQVGIDDFAFRRGLKYGTILVDLQTHRVVDLLADRSVATATTWFKEHPDIRVVSRDRGMEYATAASQGAPQAIQVADRWHIVHHLSEAVSLVLEHSRAQLRSVSQALVPPRIQELEKQYPKENFLHGPSSPLPIASGQPYRAPFIQQVQRTRRENRLERYQQIVDLQRQGMTVPYMQDAYSYIATHVQYMNDALLQLGAVAHLVEGYIATHVQYMNDARSQKMQRGLWGGGSLTAPYVIDKNVWKDEQLPIVYTPWLEPALDLFIRFKAYDFSTSRVCRYIESLPFVFPVPSYEDTQLYIFRTNMRLVSGGYTFSDVSTVRYFLSNLTLGGYAKVGEDEEGNELLVPDAFEAAIPFDLLDPAYAAITGHHIDGALFEGYKNTRRYTRSEPQGPRTLFQSSILTSDQGHISADIRESKGFYECFEGLQQEGYSRKLRSGLLEAKILWVLPARSFDQLIADRLCDLARHDSEIAERVKAAYEGQKGHEVDETNLLQGQIERTQQRIQRLDFLLTNPNIPLDEETAKGYAKDLAELRPKLARLMKKQQTKPEIDPGETITNFYFVLSHLPTEFKKQSIDVQRQIMSKLVKQIVVNNISPHLFRLYIVWQDGVATRPDVALLWRGQAVLDDEGWREEDDTIIRSHFATTPQPDIMRRLPTHTWTSIRQHANALGIIRSKELKGGRKKVNPYYETTSYADFETAMKYAENGEDKAYMCEKVNELAEKTPRGQISPYWPLPAELVSFSSFVSDQGEWST